MKESQVTDAAQLIFGQTLNAPDDTTTLGPDRDLPS